MNPDCHYGDHLWRGSSQCVRCGERLRCWCGVYVREDNIDAHIERRPHFARLLNEERDELNTMLRGEAMRGVR